VRFSVAVENYNHQHQDLRVENGVEYGDTVDKMDFPYLRKVTALNVAPARAGAGARCRRSPRWRGRSHRTTIRWVCRPKALSPTSCAGAGRMQPWQHASRDWSTARAMSRGSAVLAR
jgi:hypothetical protein